MLKGSEANLEHWNVLTDEKQIDDIIENSNQKLQLVYKHSHTCGICHAAKDEIDTSFDELEQEADMHFVNVKKNRAVSDAFPEQLGVRHESPQVLIIKDGECVWHKSHWSIKGDDVLQALKNA